MAGSIAPRVGGGGHAVSGFSLIEVVAVLVLLGVLSAGATALYDDGNAAAVAEAEIFKSHLRYAQIRAMGDIVPWTIEVGSGSYALSKGESGSTTSQNLPGESGATHQIGGGVTATAGTFTFNWRGCLVNAASPNVCLSTPGLVTFDGDPDIEVTVQAETGFAQ